MPAYGPILCNHIHILGTAEEMEVQNSTGHEMLDLGYWKSGTWGRTSEPEVLWQRTGMNWG